MNKLIIHNIGLIQSPIGSFSHGGSAQGENLKLRNGAILIEDGIIKEIYGTPKLNAESDIEHASETEEERNRALALGLKGYCGEAISANPKFMTLFTEIIGGERASESEDETSYSIKLVDAGGKMVTPGLVEGHTHLIFGGYRQHEIPMKIKGATYIDILKAGGGILDTVRKTREATEDELFKKTIGFLDEMMSLGVTTCEAKSGYGLNTETELKLLRVINKADEEHEMDLVPTFMGAHAIPEEYKGRADEFIDMLCDEMLPEIKESGLAEYADIFTEVAVFDKEQSRRYLQKAKELNFGLKVHADEIEAIGGSELAGEMGAVSAEHLISIGESGLKALAEGGVTAMCLPATSFYLGANFAPAKKMIELGIPVATASDFNPGSCPSLNLQFVMNLACIKYRMLPEEVLTAVTINPACAIGRGHKVGTIEGEKEADLVIWKAEDMETLCYRFGSNMADKVIKKGKITVSKGIKL